MAFSHQYCFRAGLTTDDVDSLAFSLSKGPSSPLMKIPSKTKPLYHAANRIARIWPRKEDYQEVPDQREKLKGEDSRLQNGKEA